MPVLLPLTPVTPSRVPLISATLLLLSLVGLVLRSGAPFSQGTLFPAKELFDLESYRLLRGETSTIPLHCGEEQVDVVVRQVQGVDQIKMKAKKQLGIEKEVILPGVEGGVEATAVFKTSIITL